MHEDRWSHVGPCSFLPVFCKCLSIAVFVAAASGILSNTIDIGGESLALPLHVQTTIDEYLKRLDCVEYGGTLIFAYSLIYLFTYSSLFGHIAQLSKEEQSVSQEVKRKVMHKNRC